MLSNTRDAKRICQLLELFIVIFCYHSGNKNILCLSLKSADASSITGYS